MRSRALLSAVLGAWVGSAAAETAYVTDNLELGLHAASDTSDRPFENLVSGMAVEVLERNSSYARVRLGDGREGWVRAAYLVAEKPAAARGRETTSELTGSAETLAETIERLRAENRAYEQRFESYRYALPLLWVMPALVVTLVAGFLAGLWWLDALIRRRHGGFRIY